MRISGVHAGQDETEGQYDVRHEIEGHFAVDSGEIVIFHRIYRNFLI